MAGLYRLLASFVCNQLYPHKLVRNCRPHPCNRLGRACQDAWHEPLISVDTSKSRTTTSQLKNLHNATVNITALACSAALQGLAVWEAPQASAQGRPQA